MDASKWQKGKKAGTLKKGVFCALLPLAVSACVSSPLTKGSAMPNGADCPTVSRLLSQTPPQGSEQLTQLALRKNPRLSAKVLEIERLRSFDRIMGHTGASVDILSGQPSAGLSNLVGLIQNLIYRANPKADPERERLRAQLKTLKSQVARSVATEFQSLAGAKAKLEGLRRDKARIAARVDALRLISRAVRSPEAQEDLARAEQKQARIEDRHTVQETQVRKAVQKILSLAGCLLPSEEKP